ncbi:F-box protein At4g22280-like [Carex rostrata]
MMEGGDFARDRISGLPDPLLTHILSFLPTEEAVCTCILSKRWMRVWASLPVLVFDDHKSPAQNLTEEEIQRLEAKFVRLLGGVIFNREKLTLDTFKLTWWVNEWSSHYLVYGFLRCAVMRRPRVLSIHMLFYTFLNLPDSIFTCTSIEEMSIRLETDDNVVVVNEFNFLQMRSINLPFLKSLELGKMDLNDDIMRMFISGCPVLENLVLKDCWLEVSMISSNVLKKLVLMHCCQFYPLEISCPGVVSLIIMSMYMRDTILKNMSSLATADIFYGSQDVSDLRLLSGLSNVTSLKLETNNTDVMDLLLADIPNCPPLKNLKSLELRQLNFKYDWNLVACLLQHSTNLKDLTLHFFRPSEDDTGEEFQEDISFRHEYLEAVKISCPGKTVKLAGEVVHNYCRVETTAKIIIS